MSDNPYRQARYLLSAHTLDQLPADDGHEIAFVGRSNAGKSSALNSISGCKTLARTSKTPGRTQQINFFTVDVERRLVDLPGYGYAKVPHALRRLWSETINEYFNTRTSLAGVILIMDSRRDVRDEERRIIDWCAQTAIPVHVLLSKSDKLGVQASRRQLQAVRQAVQGAGAGCTLQLFSAMKGTGVEEARRVLDQWFGLDEKRRAPAI